MIKFFRKIRQNLLTENKFSKYLLYAIGEIVLVVIGILIALQLNNYNDDLKRAKQEQITLRNLKLDFEYNLSEIKQNIKTLQTVKKVSLSILDHTGKKFSDNFDVDKTLELVPSTLQYFPQNGFLLELVNSGNLGIIKSDMLRNKLSYWLPTLETLADREKISVEFNKDFLRYVIKNGSWLNVDEESADKQITDIKFPKSGFDIDNNQMLKSVEFENIIENQIINQTILLERQERCLELNIGHFFLTALVITPYDHPTD